MANGLTADECERVNKLHLIERQNKRSISMNISLWPIFPSANFEAFIPLHSLRFQIRTEYGECALNHRRSAARRNVLKSPLTHSAIPRIVIFIRLARTQPAGSSWSSRKSAKCGPQKAANEQTNSVELCIATRNSNFKPKKCEPSEKKELILLIAGFEFPSRIIPRKYG